MEFLRFASSQRYGSRVPLRQLAFRVTVSRAFLIEEESAEVLCEVVVPWAGKLPSPKDRLAMHQRLEDTLQGSAPPAAMRAADSGTPSGAHAFVTDAGDTQVALSDGAASAAAAAAQSRSRLPTAARVAAQLQAQSARLFTHPPADDFIDTAEEECPVDPPYGPSLLAPIVLRQHRRDHLPNRSMHVMYASGSVRGLPTSAHAGASAEPAEDAEAAGDSADAAVPVRSLEWVGEDKVVCTITSERDECFFKAKPSLNEVHTLFVDAVYIYSFVVSAVELSAVTGGSAGARDAAAASVAQSSLVLADVAPAALAAATRTSESIRTAARRTHSDIGAVDPRGDQRLRSPLSAAGAAPLQPDSALARRMLRDAALSLPDTRDAMNVRAAREVVSAAAAGTVSADDGDLFTTGESASVASTVDTRDAAAKSSARLTASRLVPPRRASIAEATVTGAVVGAGPASAADIPHGCCQYYIYGEVERCLGVPYDTVYLKCTIQQDSAPDGGACTRDVPTFFMEQEALAAQGAALGSGLGGPSPPAMGATAAPGQPHSLVFCTQLAMASTMVIEDYIVQVDHLFNTPFEYSYVDKVQAAAPLRLAVVALSEGFSADGHQTPVGYCSVSLPTLVPGTHKIETELWAPSRTGKEYVRSVMLGGAPSLVDVRESGPTVRNRTGISVRQGFMADSAGRLRLTITVLQQHPTSV